MSVIYQTTITRIGQSAMEALGEQMLITFREGAPADIEEFCFIHCHGELTGALQPGARCELGQHCYPVTAVGSVPSKTCVNWGISLCASMVCVKRNFPAPYTLRGLYRTISRRAVF